MAEETGSVRITNAQVYEKLMEINAVQIEMVAEIRGLKSLPDRVAIVEQELARLKVIAGLSYALFTAVLIGVVTALLRLVN
jgi:hypothetical protein